MSLKEENDGKWKVTQSIYKAVEGALGIVVITEWEEFRHINWAKVSELTNYPIWLFDTRHICDKEEAIKHNIKVWTIGI